MSPDPSAAPSSPSPATAARPTRASRTAEEPTGVRTHPRPAGLRRPPTTMRISMVLFFLGGLALLAVLVMFASGVRDFPWWLWALIGLAAIGLILGSFAVGKAGRTLDDPPA